MNLWVDGFGSTWNNHAENAKHVNMNILAYIYVYCIYIGVLPVGYCLQTILVVLHIVSSEMRTTPEPQSSLTVHNVSSSFALSHSQVIRVALETYSQAIVLYPSTSLAPKFIQHVWQRLFQYILSSCEYLENSSSWSF